MTPPSRQSTAPAERIKEARQRQGWQDQATAQTSSTRERILDVALDLFIDKGFDGTSLREIAEQLGITKAALYYHFASKDDILRALHLRLHDLGRDSLRQLVAGPVTLSTWERLLDGLWDQMLSEGKLLRLHQRNQAALEKLHADSHDADHEDLHERFGEILSDPSIPLEQRIKMACSFGAVFSMVFMAGDAFADTDRQELGQLVRQAIHDLLGT